VNGGAQWLVRKLGGAPVPAPPPVPQYRSPPQSPAQPPAPPSQGHPEGDPNEASVSNLLRDADRARDASKAQRFEKDRCPGCGGTNFFSRGFTEHGAPRRGPAPSPECFECGYPTVQYGSALGEGEAIGKSKGIV
jgi:hypothetical protein